MKAREEVISCELWSYFIRLFFFSFSLYSSFLSFSSPIPFSFLLNVFQGPMEGEMKPFPATDRNLRGGIWADGKPKAP